MMSKLEVFDADGNPIVLTAELERELLLEAMSDASLALIKDREAGGSGDDCEISDDDIEVDDEGNETVAPTAESD
jgi:hypothetical protein